MWIFRKKSKLDEAIDTLLDRLNVDLGNSQGANQGDLELVERLTRLKAENKKADRRVSPDTIAVVGGNLVGILIIVMYEQKHVLTSRGLSFIQRNPNNP